MIGFPSRLRVRLAGLVVQCKDNCQAIVRLASDVLGYIQARLHMETEINHQTIVMYDKQNLRPTVTLSAADRRGSDHRDLPEAPNRPRVLALA
jgi:hypothetical protein